jgi:hypothetical protein
MDHNRPLSARNPKAETRKRVHRDCEFAPKSWIGLRCRLEVRFWEAASSRACGAIFRFRLLPSAQLIRIYATKSVPILCALLIRSSRPVCGARHLMLEFGR